MHNISVIIPIYNAEKYLEKMLNSIINQSMEDIEIILINDESEDCSLRICRKYEKIDHRIKIIDKKNEGVSQARNAGIDIATGEFIMFLDADDWVDPNICEDMYKSIKEQNADMCFCNHIMEYDNRSVECNFVLEQEVVQGEEIKNGIILPLIESERKDILHDKASFRGPWGKLFKRDIIIKNNIRFNSKLSIGEDLIFNFEYLKYVNKVVMLNKNLYHYRINNESALFKYKKDSWKVYGTLLREIEKYLIQYYDANEYAKRLNKLKIKYLLICVRNEMNPLNKKTIKEKVDYIKNTCNDQIIKTVIKTDSKGTLGKKNKVILFLLRHKIYLPIFVYGNLKGVCRG